MSDTDEVSVRKIRESPTVDAVCRQLERHVPSEESDLAIAFAEIFFSKAPTEFLRERSSDALAHMALGAFRFLQGATPDEVDVQILNPDVDNEGWYAPVTVIRTNISERPFIVDTIREYLHSRDLAIEHYIYPVIHVLRDGDGQVVEVRPSRDGESRESIVHCEIARVTDAVFLEEIKLEIARRLQDVVRATEDFQAMLAAVDRVHDELGERAQSLPDRADRLEEIREFLSWLRDEAFVFLGYRAYDLIDGPDGERAVRVEPGSGLGILKNEGESSFSRPVPLSELGEGIRPLVVGGPDLIISKTNAESTVHRRARMDYIGVKRLDDSGRVVGEHRFVGLFTSRAYAEDAASIPILRHRLQHILDEAGVQEGSHDYKEIITIFNSMPKEELFFTSAEEIGADVKTVLTSFHAEGVRVTLREDPLRRGVSVMVILPKERFSGEVRRQIESQLVEMMRGEVLNYHLALGEGDQARLHFYLSAPPEAAEAVKASALEAAVRELTRSWTDLLREGLERIRPPDEARRLARVYGEAFSAEYRAATEPSIGVQDILELEAMVADGRRIAVTFSNRHGSVAAPDVENVTELKVYIRGDRLVLSDFMPILEDCGLRVIAVNPFDVGGPEPAVIHAFAVQDAEGGQIDVDARGTLLGQTLLAAWAGDVTSDELNALVLGAGLHWREVDLLRSYAAYAFQANAVPSRVALPSALVEHPHLARVILDLFEVKFDPASGSPVEDRLAAVEDIRALVFQSLRSVASLTADRALRRLVQLVDGTVRTNFYRCGGRNPTARSGGVPYVSLKIAAREVEFLSGSRLLYEVWVRSARMEGVHLRGARVARGGIRWSDRPDDFRSEVLGLVKTQMVKNAVIVPAGSKGGFVQLRPPRERNAWLEDGRQQYSTLMRGLLDITDNLDEAGNVVGPDNVVAFDDPDPYLVVAADKGTASFSDLANEISGEYGFWLGDAFASGGSNGYDHKAVGITARGAWECVKRHFKEMGKDIQTEPFTVVGIGDMSGDVFGNGMLLSRAIRLVAAFDHRHVFIDPDPDEATSYEERERLFQLGRSSWEDYDESLLSPGGLIVPRGAKEVVLSSEAKAALGLPEDAPTFDGESLIRAVLRAPVELLWNGGIGTYVKSSRETHSSVSDSSNDAVRVDADELRCKVVGEGGNLGLTQLGRLQYALRGGRINTDALDNSGGVDLSDREVNLKILLREGERAGRMSAERRNPLLEELTDPVAELVLQDSRSQSLAVSLDELRVSASENQDDFRELMSALEKAGELDRASEFLPTFEALVERAEDGQGLVRPELCVLLAYAKLHLMSRVLSSSVPDDAATRSYLLGYFPPVAYMEAGDDALDRHRLRREIVASQVTNDLVDLMGSTFVHRAGRNTGKSASEVVRAWLIASRLAGHRTLMTQLAEARSLPAAVAYRWLLGLSRVLERTTHWLLQNVASEVPTAEVIEKNLDGLATLRRVFPDLVAGEERRLFESRVEELEAAGAESGFARDLMTLRFLDQLLEILRAADETDSDVTETAHAFYAVSEHLAVSWLREQIFESVGDDRWERRAARAVADDLAAAHHGIVAAVMKRKGDDEVEASTERFFADNRRAVDRFWALLDELRQEPALTLAALTVAVRQISDLTPPA